MLTRLGAKSVRKLRTKAASERCVDRIVDDQPDTDLYFLIKNYQEGDAHSGWLFVQHQKIQSIISFRLHQYRGMFHWLPQEDLDDIRCSLSPRILEILHDFKLPKQPHDGRVVSYFSLRLRGEADYLLKCITNMKQVVDNESGKSYLKYLDQSIDGFEDILLEESDIPGQVISDIEHTREESVLHSYLESLPDWSNDRIWLRCYILRLKDKTWAQIAKDIGYKYTDYTWLKDNTDRFVTRLKHRFIIMGESVNYRICGIYTDHQTVAIAIFDPSDRRNNSVWSREYKSYADLDRVEAKLGDLFRQFHISYVMMNEESSLSKAHVIAMRYLSKRESFVETINLKPFMSLVSEMPDSIGGIKCSNDEKVAILTAHIKKAYLDEEVERARDSRSAQ